MRKCLLVLLVSMLAACTQPRGAWGDEAGASRYVFERDGRVGIEVAGGQRVGHYRRDGEVVHIDLGDGVQLAYRFQEDGSLVGPMGIRLVPLDE